MRLPMKARSTASRILLLASVALVGACSGEVTSPAATQVSRSVEAKSMFVPDAATKALYGVVDGTYSVTFDPRYNQSFSLGPNKLVIPASSVCDMATSGYGPSMWNAPCTPHTLPIVLTVVIRGATTDTPRVDFYPAMRFNPTKTVQLFMYVPKVNPADRKNWVMTYCHDFGGCIDESVGDPSMATYIDYDASVLFRRIKHFSGYATAEFKEVGAVAPLP